MEDVHKPVGQHALLVEAWEFTLQYSTHDSYLFYRSWNPIVQDDYVANIYPATGSCHYLIPTSHHAANT